MKRFNAHKHAMINRAGFSFLEIVLTITLIGAVLTPLYAVQYNIFSVVMRAFDEVSRLFLIQNLFYPAILPSAAADAEQKMIEKKIQDPSTAVTYELGPIAPASRLAGYDNLYLAVAQGSWSRAGVESKEKIVTFVYRAPKSKAMHNE